jgi:hypothetical protein
MTPFRLAVPRPSHRITLEAVASPILISLSKPRAAAAGWGDPLDRDSAWVRDDVLDGFVSLARAHDDYGVVLEPRTFAVDDTETRTRRRSLRRQTAMFHRGRYLTELFELSQSSGSSS